MANSLNDSSRAVSSLEYKVSIELTESLPYRIKKVCEGILIELEKAKMGSLSIISFQVMSSKLLQFAEEADTQSASGGLLRNLADVMPFITSANSRRISIAESIARAVLARFESERYSFGVTSKCVKSCHAVPDFLSQRMRSASLVSNVKALNRASGQRRREVH